MATKCESSACRTMRSTRAHSISAVPDVRAIAVSLIVATIGVLAAIANMLWGTEYPNLSGTRSESAVSASTYLKARQFDALAFLSYSLSAENPGGTNAASRQRTLLVASQLAPNDAEVVRALAALAFQRGEMLEALNQSARLASISPTDRGAAIDILLSAANTREWPNFVNGQLETKWPLADALLNVACGKLAGDQLLALGAAISRSVAVSSQTSACVSRKLIAENRSPDARAFWLGTLRPLPPSIGHVFNGDFSLALGDSPFNWSLAVGGEFRDGFRVGVVDAGSPDRKARSLQVRFNGRRVNSSLVEQSLALPPGLYRLRYATKQSGFAGAESARWIVRCEPAAVLVDQRPERAEQLTDGWAINSSSFAISDACRGQTIRLELSSRLQQLTGTNASAAFSGIEITRIGLR